MTSLSSPYRFVWAFVASLLVHVSLVAAVFLWPMIRGWLRFGNQQAPNIELGLGIPDFVDLEQDGEDKKEEPDVKKEPEEKEPEKAPEPVASNTPEPPPLVRDPDSYIEPTSTPSSQSASAPTSVPAKKEGLPMQPTAIVDSLPNNAKMLLLLGSASMRKSPHKKMLGAALRSMYDADRTFGGAGLDPLEDVEEILIGTTNPWNLSRWAFVVHYAGTEVEQKARMEKTAAKAGDSIRWKKELGKDLGVWAKQETNSDHYEFAFLSPGILAIAPLPTLKDFLGKTAKPAEPNPSTATPTSEPTKTEKPGVLGAVASSRGTAPAVLYAVTDIKNLLPLGVLTRNMTGGLFSIDWGESAFTPFGYFSLFQAPQYFRLSAEIGDAAIVTVEGRFASEAEASDAIRKIPPLRKWLEGFAPKPLTPIIQRLNFEREGVMVRSIVVLSPEEMADLLAGLSPILMGELVVPVEGDLGEPVTPPVTPTPIPVVPTPPTSSQPVTP